MKNKSIVIYILFLLTAVTSYSQDIFQFNAPPGGVYLNASYEQNGTDSVSITVEHDGAAIPSWFIAIDEGTSAGYEPRELTLGVNTMNYQIYKTSSPSASVIKAPTETLGLSNVISTTDFNSVVGSMEQQTYTIYFYLPSGQFIPAGNYTDTVTMYLYKGDYDNSGSHFLADSVNITVTGRMASLLDIYSTNEPGIRFMNLTISQTDKLIATINERSNSSTGYTVSITSKNLANDGGGATAPYFLQSASADQLTYALKYDGAAVGPWTAGTAQITDYALTTAPEWLSKQLRISYSGSTALAAGDYEDILTLTISAK